MHQLPENHFKAEIWMLMVVDLTILSIVIGDVFEVEKSYFKDDD